MSGGYFCGHTDRLAEDLFAFQYPHYGQKGFSGSALARQQNPLEDKTISELTWDLLCVLHAFDYYKSGDIGEDAYREDVEHFKGKWCKPYSKKRTKEIVDAEVAALRLELYYDFGLEAPNEA